MWSRLPAIVQWSELFRRPSAARRKKMFRVIVAMIIASAATAAGQILIRKGMQSVGSLETYAPMALVSYFGHALLNPYVILGTILNGVFYFLLIASLSWAEVTIAVPFTALEYGFAAVLAITILQEVVPPVRWAGIVLVMVGVLLITISGEPTAAPSSGVVIGEQGK
jgi:drug/metabolite transporter (DMT)-like permease